MKTKLMAAVALTAILSATGAANAQTASEVKALKAQAAALKKENAALEKRLGKIEKQQAREQAILARQPSPAAAPSAGSFMAQATNIPGQLLNGEGPLTWNGITIFGTFDAGIGYASHGAPLSSDFYAGNSLLSKFGNHSLWTMAPSGLSQTTLGIKGQEEILPGWAGVFYASTGINPQSGALANAPGSQVANNGVPLANQSVNADGTRGGQAFNDQLYVGVSSKTFGELTFGRHKSLSNSLLGNYDPAGAAYNYSVIGYSGTPVAGLGMTDLGRLNDTLLYTLTYGPVHFGALYKFVDGTAGSAVTCVGGTGANHCGGAAASNLYTPLQTANDGYQFNVGGKYAGFELDGVVSHFNQAVTYGTLGVGNTTVGTLVLPNFMSPDLAGTAADITSWMLAGKYTWNQFKFYVGYANDHYSNPSDPIGIGANIGQGGYSVISVSNTAFPHDKVLQTTWGGIKYAFNAQTEFTVSYYHELQNGFGTTAQMLTCDYGRATRSGNCSGYLNGVSGYVDYHFTKRFDAYAGLMWTQVGGGMAAGYLYTSNWAPTAGVRYTF